MQLTRRGVGRPFVARAQRPDVGARRTLLLFEGRGVVGFERAELRPVCARARAFELHGVEEDGRLRELVEDEDHRAEEEDEELHRHLDHPVEEQAEPALRDRLARQVALHLRLVGAEVGEREEAAAEESRPEVVLVRDVEGEVDGVQAPELARDVRGFEEGDVRRAAA